MYRNQQEYGEKMGLKRSAGACYAPYGGYSVVALLMVTWYTWCTWYTCYTLNTWYTYLLLGLATLGELAVEVMAGLPPFFIMPGYPFPEPAGMLMSQSALVTSQ